MAPKESRPRPSVGLACSGLYWDNGKENGHYYMGLYRIIYVIQDVVNFGVNPSNIQETSQRANRNKARVWNIACQDQWNLTYPRARGVEV